MIIRDNLGLKIFDIDAHSLRGKNFYKSIVDYRNKILPQQLRRIKEDSEYVCTLCSGQSGTLFLEWEEGYKLFNLYAQYQLENDWSLFLKGYNLTNELAFSATTVEAVRYFAPLPVHSVLIGVKKFF